MSYSNLSTRAGSAALLLGIAFGACAGCGDSRKSQAEPACLPFSAGEKALLAQAGENGARFDQSASAIRRVLDAWMQLADSRTSLLPQQPGVVQSYAAQNSGGDLYPHLVLASSLVAPEIYRGKMMEMLRNEIRYTTQHGHIPGDLNLTSGKLDDMGIFGASEYAKDGLVSITELLGLTPWFYRMVDLVPDIMEHAPVASRFGNLPDGGAELNGNMLQVLVRLATMTGDERYIGWARRIGDAYVEEVLPKNEGLPSQTWDFTKHSGKHVSRLRDHGNETLVGLTLLFAFEQSHGTERAMKYRPVIERMLDLVLQSANPDGMLYSSIKVGSLQPVDDRLNDNWGYVYGAVYTFYLATGDEKYRDAVRKVLGNLPKYVNVQWETHPMDGYADSIESALYLVAHEPVPEAREWIETEIRILAAMQKPSGLVEGRYLDGNFSRTMLMYALYKSGGCRPDPWTSGLQLGAVAQDDILYLSVRPTRAAARWKGNIRFDWARHKRIWGFDRNYPRVNEYPEWFVVDENTLYRVRSDSGVVMIRLGSELIQGVPMESGEWIVEPYGKLPYGPSHVPRKAGQEKDLQ